MQAIILAGGAGTRLQALFADRPKILVPIAGRPFLEWQLEWFGRNGITDIHIAGGIKADVLKEWLKVRGTVAEGREQKDHTSLFTIHTSLFTFHVSLSSEPRPLGTGGGLKFVEPWIQTSPCLVVNGDSLLPNLNLKDLTEHHARSSCSITLAITHIEDAARFGTVKVDDTGHITAFLEKAAVAAGWVNGGVYVVNKEILDTIPTDRTVSIERDIFPTFADRHLLGAFSCPTPLLDMGTAEGIESMERFLADHTNL